VPVAAEVGSIHREPSASLCDANSRLKSEAARWRLTVLRQQPGWSANIRVITVASSW